MKLGKTFLILITGSLISPQVLAHNSHIASGFMAGLTHPFSGADHIITLLVAGLLIGRFAAGQVKLAVSIISLLMLSYLWLHGTEMLMMNNSFIIGFLVTSMGIISTGYLSDKFFNAKLQGILTDHD